MEEPVPKESYGWRLWKEEMIRAAVLGSPIAHSLSPVLHRAAYDALGLKGEYEAIDVTESELSSFIASRDKTWTGFSLTMPLKERVLDIASSVDPLALQIRSANTLIRSESVWHALTTDVSGFHHAMTAHGVTTYEKVLIIGAGATARAAAAACDQVDREIIVISRSKDRENAMHEAARKGRISFISWNEKLPDADLIINTTPSGVADTFIEQFISRPRGIYFEALYHPWPTKLLNHWRFLGGGVIDGLDLLAHQAMDQISLMCRVPVNRDEMAPILRAVGLIAIQA
jgi:shikimate dehydrogenase